MPGDGGIDQVAAQRPQPRERAILVRAAIRLIADHVGGKDRCDFPGLAIAPFAQMHNSTKAGL